MSERCHVPEEPAFLMSHGRCRGNVALPREARREQDLAGCRLKRRLT